VVVISTAHGLKFADQKTAYHMGRLADVRSTHGNRPVEVAPDIGKIVDVIAAHAGRATRAPA
jgi:threonine synthase